MSLKPNMNFEDWIQVLWRWKWLIVFSFLFFMFAGSIYSVVSPEIYKSTSTVLVIPQKIDDDYIKSTTRENIEIGLQERINTLQVKILSRTRLMTIIEELNLFSEIRADQGDEFAVKMMRQRINVQPMTTQKRFERLNNVFSIEYEDEDPKNAMLVTSNLTSMFIDENVKAREQQVAGTIELFESQISETEKKLEEKDKAIKEFRTTYLGELPEQLNANMEMLRRYEDDLKSVKSDIRAAKDTRILLQSQIVELKAQLGMLETNNPKQKEGDSSGSIRELSLYSQLSEKKALLSQARMKFTESHPEIKRLVAEINELEKMVEGIAVDDSRLDKEFSVFASPEAAKLTQQLTIIIQGKKAKDLEIKNLMEKQKELESQIDLYMVKVANTPAREEKLKELVRDYENLRANYEDLLAKKMSADLSRTMERRQQGERFEIIDPPSVPGTPHKPNRKMILFASLILSIGIGVGGSIGLEYRDDTLKSPGEFKGSIDIPVLVSLPLILTKSKRRERFIKKSILICGLLFYFGAVLVFVVLYMDRIKLIVTGGN